MKHPLPSMEHRETVSGIFFLFAQILVIPFAVVLFCDLSGITLSVPLQNVICFGLNFICAAVLFFRFWLRSLADMRGKSLRILRSAATYFGFYYISTLLVNILILTMAPEFSNANDAAISAMTSQSQLLMGISVVLLVPPVEEILYRGVVFGGLYSRHPILAYGISILAFAAVHVIGYIGSVPPLWLLFSLLQYIPAGFCLARAYVETGSIFTPILIHAIINFIGVLSM